MRTRLLGWIIIVAVLAVIGAACSSSKTAATGAPTKKETAGVYQSLLDYLRRNPSVRVIGTGENIQIMLRGVDNLNGDIEPLFVIDKMQVNSYAQAARLVDVNDVQSVQVLNVMDASAAYGLRGNKGAVVIRTKVKN